MWVTQTSKTAGEKVRRDVSESRQSLNQVRQWQAVSPRIFMMSIYCAIVNYRLDTEQVLHLIRYCGLKANWGLLSQTISPLY